MLDLLHVLFEIILYKLLCVSSSCGKHVASAVVIIKVTVAFLPFFNCLSRSKQIEKHEVT